jgi:Uma2 family endonuclease
MQPMQQLTTAVQLLTMPDDGAVYELVRGELRRMTPSGHRHGAIAMRIGWKLAEWVDRRRLGRVFAAETGFLLARAPDTVLAPDVAFVRAERLVELPDDGFFPGPPDLAIEVRSPGDSRRAMAHKAGTWLAHGCPLVWLVDGAGRTVTIHRCSSAGQHLGVDATLTGESELSGFALPLAELFDDR